LTQLLVLVVSLWNCDRHHGTVPTGRCVSVPYRTVCAVPVYCIVSLYGARLADVENSSEPRRILEANGPLTGMLAVSLFAYSHGQHTSRQAVSASAVKVNHLEAMSYRAKYATAAVSAVKCDHDILKMLRKLSATIRFPLRFMTRVGQAERSRSWFCDFISANRYLASTERFSEATR